MDEHEETERRKRAQRQPGQAQGVRIIGAEEAAAALEAGEASGRRPLSEQRFGDVPRPPGTPRPVHRFPLPDSVDPTEAVPRPPLGGGTADRASHPGSAGVSPRAGEPAAGEPTVDLARAGWDRSDRGDPTATVAALGDQDDVAEGFSYQPDAPEMLHWTEPPTGEVPQVLLPENDDYGDEQDDDIAAWASLPSRKASWRDEHDDWEGGDYEPGILADDEAPLGALAETRVEEADFFSFDVVERGTPPEEELFEEPPVAADPGSHRAGRRHGGRARPAGQGAPDEVSGDRGGRDMRRAVMTGIGLAIVALVLFKMGPATALFLSIMVVTLAAAELFAVLRRHGFRPATLLGLVATVGLMVATYLKGEAAVPLVLVLTVVFGLLWFLAGVERDRPTLNFALTIGAFLWVGLLGSFASLLLDPTAFPNRHGVAFLLAAVVATIAYDVGGYLLGQFGRRQLAREISPNKTWEGLVGGAVLSLLVCVVVISHLHPWTLGRAAALGLVVAVVAPLGDLCESMIKRDLGVKDMGSILPGHGGILDRVDAMIFVLPATYFLVRILNIG